MQIHSINAVYSSVHGTQPNNRDSAGMRSEERTEIEQYFEDKPEGSFQAGRNDQFMLLNQNDDGVTDISRKEFLGLEECSIWTAHFCVFN